MNYKLYNLAAEEIMNYRFYTLASENMLNYKLCQLAAKQILIADRSGKYNVREKYKGLTRREIENKILELYELLEVALDMGIAFQVAEEERLFHYHNGVAFTNDEVQEAWVHGYKK